MRNEPKLIEIENAKKVIFVGDTHGDLEASQKVIKNYLKPGNKIVFLGDYVDRGPFSKENLNFLLETKNKYPDQIYLLQGNHEGHHILKFYPAEFWESLSQEEYKKYCSIVEKFPLIIITKDIIALHGALPDCPRNVLGQIKTGSEEWRQITWGDFEDNSGGYLGIDPFTGRPQFGRDYFFKMMERFGKKNRGTLKPQSGWGAEIIIVLGLASHNFLPSFSKFSIVFLTCALSSGEPTEGKIIGG